MEVGAEEVVVQVEEIRMIHHHRIQGSGPILDRRAGGLGSGLVLFQELLPDTWLGTNEGISRIHGRAVARGEVEAETLGEADQLHNMVQGPVQVPGLRQGMRAQASVLQVAVE